MKRLLTTLLALASLAVAEAQPTVMRLYERAENQPTIAKEIYGHFSEHLGTCIYGGLWVGEESEIPNINGYRTDVLEALKALQVPVLRWPGGCFADEYHWRDGIGPREQRPVMVNTHWGGTVENNAFGTHEFLNLCELLGCEPYITGNVGSGTVEEMSKWVEYMTAPSGPMAELRKQNGREKPWRVKYFGVGNENWGCGGNMRPEYYADLYRRYATYCRNYPGNSLYKIACGPSDYDYKWTEVLLKQVGTRMNALTLHYYSVDNWSDKGSATNYTADEYYQTLGKALEIEPVIKRHVALMDSYDPQHRIALLVDEWGTWFNEEPGTVRGHLYQQSTMRDAMVAAMTFNIFHRYAHRIRMANIAQVANVLQSVVLTRGAEMVLTPTYHTFYLYRPHMDAQLVPIDFKSSTRKDSRNRPVAELSATASCKEGKYHVSIVNPLLDEKQEVLLQFESFQANKVSGLLLTAEQINDFNDFDHANTVRPTAFKGAKLTREGILVELPAKSIVTLTIE